MLHTVTEFFLHAHPLLICLSVMIVLLLESTGVPIANTTLLLFAGALASLGHVNIWLLAFFAVSGSTLGACSAYLLGAYGGRKILSRWTRIFHISEEDIMLVESWFQRAGVWMLLFSRMIPYIRPFACFPAGICRMPFSRFLVSALAGSLIWCAALLSIGWGLGSRWRVALYAVQYYTVPTICLVLLFLAASLFAIYQVRRHLNAQLVLPVEESCAEEQDCEDLLAI